MNYLKGDKKNTIIMSYSLSDSKIMNIFMFSYVRLHNKQA
ncbi:unknown [Klebsiella variicola CAG:634]|nr:unknown [Klebsiella variicola CAG:634]